MSKNVTMSIYAEALAYNKQFSKNKITASTLGFAEFCTWKKSIINAENEAYKVAEYRYNHMGDAEVVQAMNLSPLYEAIRPIIKLIGDVNGDTLMPENVAEMFVAKSLGFRKIDISNEMAHARNVYQTASKAHRDAEQGKMSDAEFAEELARLEEAKDSAHAEVKRLEDEPGNCKNIPTMVSESTFVKEIQEALGDAILKQNAEPHERILERKAAKEAARKEKRRANKNAKKAAK